MGRARLGVLVGWAVALAGCAVGSTSPGAASLKVVVLDVKHARPDVRDTVVSILESRYDVVPDGDYRATARKLGARTMQARNVAKVTEKLGLDAAVYGALVRTGPHEFALRVSLREGRTGRMLDRFTLPVEGGRISRSELSEKLYDVLDRLAPDDAELAMRRDADRDSEPADEAPRVARKAKPPAHEEVDEEPTAPPPKPKLAKHEARDEEITEDTEPEPSRPVSKGKKPAAPPRTARAPIAKAPPPSKSKPADKVAKNGNGKKGKADPVAVDEDDAPPLATVKTDEDGQAIDDEAPPGFVKKK